MTARAPRLRAMDTCDLLDRAGVVRVLEVCEGQASSDREPKEALLEAMEERQVIVDGVTQALRDPFVVFATQNPIEYEGTYPLPEAQLNRKAVAHQVLSEREAALSALRERGVSIVDVPADRLTTATINRYREMRAGSLV